MENRVNRRWLLILSVRYRADVGSEERAGGRARCLWYHQKCFR
ncbi:Uncharacterised protein [Vibrio cholerae]|nr:Uncharacterised protein [Vibrio cholerae]